MLELHTLEARDNVMLDVVFAGKQEKSGEEIRQEIVAALATAVRALERRNLRYSDFVTALTPQLQKKEIAFLFDSRQMGNWYGFEAAEAVLPLLDRSSSNSILTGDIVCHDQDLAVRALNEKATFWRDVEVRDVLQLYCVYINNLSPSSFHNLSTNLQRSCAAAIGFVDCTYSSTFKNILATCIGTRYVKRRADFLNSHPYDSEIDANENGPGWPLETYGYRCWSIDDMSFNLFMNYKIQNSLAPLAFHDGHFSMAAATGIWEDPRSVDIVINPAKLGYLKQEKSGTLSRAGLDDLTEGEIAEQLQQRMAQSYIFNIKWNSDIGYSTFATMLEFERQGRIVSLRAALRYEEASLQLVTLFG
jgi:hypothetical protein